MRLLLCLTLLGAGCALVPTQQTDCSAARPCPEGQICDALTSTCRAEPEPDMMTPRCEGDCVACKSHGDCPSLACDTTLPTPNGGRCLPASQIVYVDNRNGACAPGGDGERPETALCTAAEGLQRVDGARKRALRLAPSSVDYQVPPIDHRTVLLFGPAGSGGRAQISGMEALAVGAGGQVLVDGVDLSGRFGLRCSGEGPPTSVTLRRSLISGCTDAGIIATECALVVDRSILSRNAAAIAVSGAAAYTILNSFIVDNQSTLSPTLNFSGTGAGLFRFNTVVDNSTGPVSAVLCRAEIKLEIRDSIVFRNSTSGSPQISGCSLRNTVVGRRDRSPGGIQEDPRFTRVGDVDYGLDDSSGCCVNRVPCRVPVDYFGNPRPHGGACDVGAHEVQ